MDSAGGTATGPRGGRAPSLSPMFRLESATVSRHTLMATRRSTRPLILSIFSLETPNLKTQTLIFFKVCADVLSRLIVQHVNPTANALP